jgi:hypothetical protein
VASAATTMAAPLLLPVLVLQTPAAPTMQRLAAEGAVKGAARVRPL